MASVSLLFHGGAPGLQVGDLLRANPIGSYVFLTPDRQYARYFAGVCDHGDLYIAEPIGKLEKSMMADPFPAFCAREARIVAVPERSVALRPTERRKLFARWAQKDGIQRKPRQIAIGRKE